MGGEARRCSVGWRGWWQRNGWSHIHLCWIKIWEGYLGSEQSQPHARPHSPGFKHLEHKSPLLLTVKTSGGRDSRRNCWVFRRLRLKGPNNLRKYANPRTLGFSTRATGGRATVAYREWVKWLEVGQVPNTPPKARQWHGPLSEPSPHTEPQSSEEVALPWRLPKAPPHTIYRCLF